MHDEYTGVVKVNIKECILSSPLVWGTTCRSHPVLLDIVFRPSFVRGHWYREVVVVLLDHVSKGERIFPVKVGIFEVFPWALGDLRSGINHEHGTAALDQLSHKRGPERACPYYQDINLYCAHVSGRHFEGAVK